MNNQLSLRIIFRSVLSVLDRPVSQPPLHIVHIIHNIWHLPDKVVISIINYELFIIVMKMIIIIIVDRCYHHFDSTALSAAPMEDQVMATVLQDLVIGIIKICVVHIIITILIHNLCDN